MAVSAQLSNGPTERPTTGLRRCVASGELRPREALIRFVGGPDGMVVPDLAARLPGRGVWLSPRRELIVKACARNLFARAAKAPLRVPDDLVERVEGLLARRCLELLGLAKRAGEAVSGYELVASLLASGRAVMLLAAVDAAVEGRRKLHALARAEGREVPVVELFTSEELGRALGHDARVHVAVASGGIAVRLTKDIARLAGLRGNARQEGHE